MFTWTTEFRYWQGDDGFLAEIQLRNSSGDEFVALLDPDEETWNVSKDDAAIGVIGGCAHPDAENGPSLGLFLLNLADAVQSLVTRNVRCGYLGWPSRRDDTRGRRPETPCPQSIVTGHTPNLDGWYAQEGEYELVLMPDSSVIARIGGAMPPNAADGALEWWLDENARFKLFTKRNWNGQPPERSEWIYRLAVAIVSSQHVGDVNWRDWHV